MSQHVRQTITELEAHAKRHEDAARQTRDMANRLRALLNEQDATTPKKRRSRKATKSSTAAKAKTAAVKSRKARTDSKKNGTSLAAFVQHYLQERANAKAGPAKTADIHAAVQQLGYRFGSKNADNAVHYLRKVLRANKAFKRTGRGKYALA
jgi:urease accessory protein UreF